MGDCNSTSGQLFRNWAFTFAFPLKILLYSAGFFGGVNFREKPVMSLRSNFSGSNFRGDSIGTSADHMHGWNFS